MAYGRPSKYGYTATPSPPVDEWTDVPLAASNFHITAREGATETDKWTISNPTTSSMRIKRDSDEVSDWAPGPSTWSATPADTDQRAPAIIYKVQMDPRPLAAHALAGVTDNRWRHGECQLTVAMRLSEPSRPSGGYGHAIGCGVGLIFSKTDLGSGAALVTSNPTPPFLGTRATPDIGYAMASMRKNNDSATVDWNRTAMSQSGNGTAGINWYDNDTTTGPFGAAGALDTAVIQLPHHPNSADTNKGTLRWWFEDSRVNRSAVNGYYPIGAPGGGVRVDSISQMQSYQLDTEGTYVYIVIMPTIFDSNANAIDSEIDVLGLKYNLSHIKVGA
jgi:hypothetical protein